ncbi:MAG TPA: ABC transporter substrate-binding protein [Euryarchaeota archaeon]|nr:ABC transporter substrate-binding protein [Euryarchaeota archaeon]
MVDKKLLTISVVVIMVCSVAGVALISNSGANDGEGPSNGRYPSSVTITQNDGRKVTVATPVEKICVVNPNAAELLHILGVSDRVVGISESIAKDTEFGYIYDDVPVIGTYSTPNGEKMLELGCTIVVGQCTSMAIKDTAVLEGMGITAILLDCYGMGQLTDDLRQLASLFGHEAQARAEVYIQMYEETMAAVEQASAALDSRASVYMELSNGKAYTSRSEMSSLIELAGGHNIVVDLKENPTSSTDHVSNEAIIAYDDGKGPEFVFVREGRIVSEAEAEQKYRDLAARIGWDNIEAVKNDNVYIITQAGMLSGPRIFIGLVYLFEALHPGVLDISSAELLEEYNDKFGYDIEPMMGYRHISN